MFWPWEMIERDHEIQNPTSPDKIRLLGQYLRLGASSRVLDVGCGKGGPARILAAAHRCRILGIEKRSAFADEARERAAAEGLDGLIEIRTSDASSLDFEPQTFDVALCLGATFIWGTMADAARVLTPLVREGGSVAIAEPYWREWPLPKGVDPEGMVDLEGTVARFEQAGLRVTGLIAASDDDWDRYESLHWRAIEESLAEHPDHPQADELRAAHELDRGAYFRYKRALLGDAIFIGRRG